MLLVLFIVIFIASAIWSYKYENSAGGLLGFVIATIMAICILISGVVLLDSYENADAYIAKQNQRYEMLVYQIENKTYDNYNYFVKKALLNEVRIWNEDLVYYQNIQDNLWFGIYYPNIYDQFEFIEYK